MAMTSDEKQPSVNCQEALIALTQLLEREDHSYQDVDRLQQLHPACAKEIDRQYQLWEELTLLEVPEPSPQMDVRFYKMLSQVSGGQSTAPFPSPWQYLSGWFAGLRQPVKLALVMGVFVVGLLAGRYIWSPTAQTNNGILLATSEPTKYLTYAAAEGPWTSFDRLKGIQLTKELSKPDQRVLEALNHALLYDENINVRLSAIEAMVHFADYPDVRENLIKAIPLQTEPMVQMTLAEAMITLQEKRSKQAWNDLLRSDHVESDIKQELRDNLETILY